MNTIDLRSDTVTLPTAAMRSAMAAAPVGDDVFGEDPTVNRLESLAAEMLGKEAALFVASGTMANLVSQLAHCQRGDETLLGNLSHVFLYEQGGASALGGIHPNPLPNQPDGRIDLQHIEEAVRADNIHFPISRLLILENTHNRCAGMPLNLEYMDAAAEIARRHGLKLHVDGARLFHAAATLSTEARLLASAADSVSICLSKGLAAPAGSLVCGEKEFIGRARRMRKVLGGGMRQAGILAAAGIVALTEMTDRLVQDHEHAARLAKGVAPIDGLQVDLARVVTNMVYIDITAERWTAAEVAARLEAHGVKMLAIGPRKLRAVTHKDISTDQIDGAIWRIRQAMSADSP